jgi:hypothetical protein
MQEQQLSHATNTQQQQQQTTNKQQVRTRHTHTTSATDKLPHQPTREATATTKKRRSEDTTNMQSLSQTEMWLEILVAAVQWRAYCF